MIVFVHLVPSDELEEEYEQDLSWSLVYHILNLVFFVIPREDLAGLAEAQTDKAKALL